MFTSETVISNGQVVARTFGIGVTDANYNLDNVLFGINIDPITNASIAQENVVNVTYVAEFYPDLNASSVVKQKGTALSYADFDQDQNLDNYIVTELDGLISATHTNKISGLNGSLMKPNHITNGELTFNTGEYYIVSNIVL